MLFDKINRQMREIIILFEVYPQLLLFEVYPQLLLFEVYPQLLR